MHRRIHYAKDKGFRVGIYYADGTNASDGVKEIYDPSKVLHWGGWEGPDTKGKTYAQNPLHPEVREFFLSSTSRLCWMSMARKSTASSGMNPTPWVHMTWARKQRPATRAGA